MIIEAITETETERALRAEVDGQRKLLIRAAELLSKDGFRSPGCSCPNCSEPRAWLRDLERLDAAAKEGTSR